MKPEAKKVKAGPALAPALGSAARLYACHVAALKSELSSARIEHRTSVMDRIDPAPWSAEIERLENELTRVRQNH